MLEVQKYLLGGKTYDDLGSELGIKSTFHPNLPLVILSYNQLDSPKTNPIVRECRGLTLNSTTHNIVARSFYRFFNWGEVVEEMPLFDFSDFIVQTKEDGSLVNLYYFEGEWHANTRGSFGLDPMQDMEMTWREGFCKALGFSSLCGLHYYLDPEVTYTAEFCSPWNKIVRRYPEPKMFLLTAFRGENELTPVEVDRLSRDTPFHRPDRFEFNDIEGIQNYLREQESNDPTYEGVVICDKNFRRWKLKSSTYLGLHRTQNNGFLKIEDAIELILTGNVDETIIYFPEFSDLIHDVKSQMNNSLEQLLFLWQKTRSITSQKDFALAVVGKSPFTSILFQARKEGLSDLIPIWNRSGKIIAKFLRH